MRLAVISFCFVNNDDYINLYIMTLSETSSETLEDIKWLWKIIIFDIRSSGTIYMKKGIRQTLEEHARYSTF